MPYVFLAVCGIGGILRTDGQPIPEEWLDAIDARIAWRGPDGCGRFRDRVEIADENAPGGKRIVEVAFVHRRLSIIDHERGHQPMVSERGRDDSEGLVAVVFNGCIYNHRELRKELESKGHKFVTDHSDTEVLIHGWREWGDHLVKHLEGMFAFGVWDHNAASLFLARDAFGEKPLYIRQTEIAKTGFNAPITPVVFFASEPVAIGSIPVSDDVCGEWCRMQWLMPVIKYGYSQVFLPGPDLVDVEILSPGRSKQFTSALVRKSTSQPWFDRATNAPGRDIEAYLEHAVAKMLEADVPIGCFLSGGVDSSLIAYFAKQHRPDIHTFSVRMPDPRYDELKYADAVAKHLGIQHHALEVATSPAEDLVRLIDLMGQPFGDSSLLPTYWVSKAARQHVKVALSGDGGDELFMGYDRYVAAPLLEQHWRWLRALPTSQLLRCHPKSRLHKLGRLIQVAHDYPYEGIPAMEALFTRPELVTLQVAIADPRWKCQPECDLTIDESLGLFGTNKRNFIGLAELRDFDIEHYLPGDLLRKVDTASMTCGLEVRCPFLDRDLARAALSLPIKQLMPRGQRKGLLRQIARKHLPTEIVDRPKMGFAIPIGEWFRNDDLPHPGGGMKTLLLDHLNSAEPFGPIQLNRKAVQRFIDEHMSCKRDHGNRLFTLLTLSIWARQLKASR